MVITAIADGTGVPRVPVSGRKWTPTSEPTVLQLLPIGTRGPERPRVSRVRDVREDPPFPWMVAYRGALRWHHTFPDAITNANALARARAITHIETETERTTHDR
ncbi:hypothetical protein [Microbacterium gorillae]|uniref:hypothetical protein n=1 Tax=Microbacterium gorillae TaxID=1231063 RepID=UPI003D968711